MASEREHLRNLIFHEYQNGHSAAKAARNICTTCDWNSITERTCQRWFAKFRSGNMDRKDKQRCGRPTTIDDGVLHRSIEANPSASTRTLASALHSSHMTVFRHLKKIGKENKRGQTVPYQLSEFHKNRRISDCNWLLHKFSRGGLNRILTCDEKWIVYDNRRPKNQWLSAGQAGERTPLMKIHKKNCYCVFGGWLRVQCTGSFCLVVKPLIVRFTVLN